MYQVVMSDETIDHMVRLLDADQLPSGIGQALQLVATQIHQAADTIGESREGTARVVFAPPLAVHYHLDVHGRTAEIFRISFTINRRR